MKVALRMESVDRNPLTQHVSMPTCTVALRMESVDRNIKVARTVTGH